MVSNGTFVLAFIGCYMWMQNMFSSLTLEAEFDPKWVHASFEPFRSPSSVSLFTMKYFLEVDNEAIHLYHG